MSTTLEFILKLDPTYRLRAVVMSTRNIDNTPFRVNPYVKIPRSACELFLFVILDYFRDGKREFRVFFRFSFRVVSGGRREVSADKWHVWFAKITSKNKHHPFFCQSVILLSFPRSSPNPCSQPYYCHTVRAL